MALPAALERVRVRWVPWAPLALATTLLAWRAIRGVLAKLGHPGAALDDAYIHFQYARAFAELHPFRFQAGEPISTGATSFLWPIALAPFYAIGFRGESILWPTWALAFAALAGLAYEAYRLAEPLTGRAAAIGAGAMVLAFGGNAWCAASGMEVVPFAWLIATASRRAADWAEVERANRTPRALKIMLAFAVACPLMRPEGALTAVAIGVIVALFPRAPTLVRRAEGALFVVAALTPNLLLLVLTGHPTSSTAQVKLLFGNPYFSLSAASLANAHLLTSTILDGQVWSAEFLPKGGAGLAFAGLIAMAWRGHVTKRVARATLVMLIALMMFVPCTYVTFLWNRLRYLWPFATGWIVGLAALARVAGDVAAKLDRRLAPGIPALVAGAFAGSFVVRLDWVLDDVAQSASGIDRQQAALGRWAKKSLPPDARVGVNDTGAIAYFGDRKTFDIVGLTSPTEGRYWVGGVASRFEHYERLKQSDPGALPTHFVVYPEWMSCEALVGRTLREATVTDSSILGGQTMRASEARWTFLGTGEQPWTPLGQIDDTLDVADLESEKAHGYELLGAHDGEEAVTESNSPRGAVVLDGARTNRKHERFHVTLPANGDVLGVARLESTTEPAHVRMRVAGHDLEPVSLEPGPWVEVSFAVPAEGRGENVTVELTSDHPVASYHYWFGRR
jgi:hypothetical protein